MHLTQTQSLLGTPAYMSPEQMRSARLVDARTDIWSLGTVLYELLEGRKPFEAESFSEMCVKVAVDPPTPMVRIPPQLQAVVLRCLAKAPEQRYANMAELGRELVPFAQDPHQAGLLVDRMGRVLRRAAGGDFAVDTSASGRTAQNARDAASGPIRLQTPQPWGKGSDPAVPPWQGPGSSPAMAPMVPRAPVLPGAQPVADDRSQPFARAPSELQVEPLTVAPPRRRWPVVVGALAFGGVIAAGIVIALAGGDDATQSKPADETRAMTTVQPAPPVAPPPTAAPAAAVAPPPPVPPAPTPSGSAAVATRSGSGSDSSGSAGPTPPNDVFTSSSGHPGRHNANAASTGYAGSAHVQKATTKQNTVNPPPVTGKKPDDPKNALIEPPTTEPATQHCDPFASFNGHDCPKQQ
jgi:serine/threonine-protein kinase